MSIMSIGICQAADAFKEFVGFNRKTGRHTVRLSEDSFGMDVADDSITSTSEFVRSSVCDDVMRLGREQLQILLEQNINERLNIGESLLIYLRRQDLPETTVQRQLHRASSIATRAGRCATHYVGSVCRCPASRTPSAIRRVTQALCGEVNAMSKGLNVKKETRRKPLKTAQEKRLVKRAKKHVPVAPLGTPLRS